MTDSSVGGEANPEFGDVDMSSYLKGRANYINALKLSFLRREEVVFALVSSEVDDRAVSATVALAKSFSNAANEMIEISDAGEVVRVMLPMSKFTRNNTAAMISAGKEYLLDAAHMILDYIAATLDFPEEKRKQLEGSFESLAKEEPGTEGFNLIADGINYHIGKVVAERFGAIRE